MVYKVEHAGQRWTKRNWDKSFYVHRSAWSGHGVGQAAHGLGYSPSTVHCQVPGLGFEGGSTSRSQALTLGSRLPAYLLVLLGQEQSAVSSQRSMYHRVCQVRLLGKASSPLGAHCQ